MQRVDDPNNRMPSCSRYQRTPFCCAGCKSGSKCHGPTSAPLTRCHTNAQYYWMPAEYNCNGFMVPQYDLAFDSDGVDGAELFTCDQAIRGWNMGGRLFEGNPNRYMPAPDGPWHLVPCLTCACGSRQADQVSAGYRRRQAALRRFRRAPGGVSSHLPQSLSRTDTPHPRRREVPHTLRV